MSIVRDFETLDFVSREEWRRWLTKNHRLKEEIWLVYDKRVSRKQSFSYRDFLTDVVEEAICFGWIDSRVKKTGEFKLAIRLTPRRSTESWSKYNKRRALKLLKERKMTRAGLGVLPKDLRRKKLK